MKISLLFLSFILGSILMLLRIIVIQIYLQLRTVVILQYYVTNHDANKYYNQMPQGTVDYSNLYYKQPVHR